MSEHTVTVSWQGAGQPFDYESFPRAHDWELPGGAVIRASSAPEYKGDAAYLNPEQALVGALASCHMLTFLALAARKRWVVQRYRDDALGFLEKNEEGRMALTRVILRPAIAFAEPAPSAEEIAKLHTGAHRGCFIANSVRTRVDIEPASF